MNVLGPVTKFISDSRYQVSNMSGCTGWSFQKNKNTHPTHKKKTTKKQNKKKTEIFFEEVTSHISASSYSYAEPAKTGGTVK